jgi:hypothetical protein
MWANSGKTEQRLAKLAAIILFSDGGVLPYEFSARAELIRKVCSKRNHNQREGRNRVAGRTPVNH